MTENADLDPVEPVVVETPVEEVALNRPQFRLTGELDGPTIEALQWALGVKQTGELDVKTVKALQKKLGLQQDGVWGRELRYAFQRFLDVPLSTTFDSRSVRALQKQLVGSKKW